jgi:hypothetical protein
MNPNHCTTCDHKKNPEGGHCYMFRHAPEITCGAHTVYRTLSLSMFATHADYLKAVRAAAALGEKQHG